MTRIQDDTSKEQSVQEDRVANLPTTKLRYNTELRTMGGTSPPQGAGALQPGGDTGASTSSQDLLALQKKNAREAHKKKKLTLLEEQFLSAYGADIAKAGALLYKWQAQGGSKGPKANFSATISGNSDRRSREHHSRRGGRDRGGGGSSVSSAGGNYFDRAWQEHYFTLLGKLQKDLNSLQMLDLKITSPHLWQHGRELDLCMPGLGSASARTGPTLRGPLGARAEAERRSHFGPSVIALHFFYTPTIHHLTQNLFATRDHIILKLCKLCKFLGEETHSVHHDPPRNIFTFSPELHHNHNHHLHRQHGRELDLCMPGLNCGVSWAPGRKRNALLRSMDRTFDLEVLGHGSQRARLEAGTKNLEGGGSQSEEARERGGAREECVGGGVRGVSAAREDWGAGGVSAAREDWGGVVGGSAGLEGTSSSLPGSTSAGGPRCAATTAGSPPSANADQQSSSRRSSSANSPSTTTADANRLLPPKSSVTVKAFSSKITVINSKQKPRIVRILGSDGRVYQYLLKGHEDLKQDERVMQVLRLVNSLLRKKPKRDAGAPACAQSAGHDPKNSSPAGNKLAMRYLDTFYGPANEGRGLDFSGAGVPSSHEQYWYDSRTRKLTTRKPTSVTSTSSGTSGNTEQHVAEQYQPSPLSTVYYPIVPLSNNAGLIYWLPGSETFHSLVKKYREPRKVSLAYEYAMLQYEAGKWEDLPGREKVLAFRRFLAKTEGRDLEHSLWLSSASPQDWLQRR